MREETEKSRTQRLEMGPIVKPSSTHDKGGSRMSNTMELG